MQKRALICVPMSFKFDRSTELILSALTQKAQQGVKVRLLIDLIGSLGANFQRKGFQSLKDAGGRGRIFIPFLKRPLQSYINLREHRKIYLFDKKRLLSGGMNLSDEYMGVDDGTERWDDLMYYLEGPEVTIFYSIFHNDWGYATQTEEKMNLSVEDEFHDGDCHSTSCCLRPGYGKEMHCMKPCYILFIRLKNVSGS